MALSYGNFLALNFLAKLEKSEITQKSGFE